jgi:hypothetical protein
VLSWLESSSVAVWVGQSPSVWAFPTVLTLHTAGMVLLVGASWVLDLRLLGVSRKIPLSAFRWVFPAIAIGLSVNLITGAVLFTKNATTWGASIPFFVKMGLVIASVATLMPIRSFVLRDAERGGVSALPAEAHTAKLGRRLAMASLLAWAGAVTAGRLLAYII